MTSITSEIKEYFKTLSKIRKSYNERWNGKEYQYPYKFEHWFENMTPIEHNVWNSIRFLGLPFYGQFPAGKYYLDFADPFKKIGIEVDGKIHNTPESLKRDKRRQEELEKEGWKIIRIPGWKTYRCIEDYYLSEEDIQQYQESEEEIPEGNLKPEFWTDCAEGMLIKLKQRYY